MTPSSNFFYNSDSTRPLYPLRILSRNWSGLRDNRLCSASQSSRVDRAWTRKSRNPVVQFCVLRPIESRRVTKLRCFFFHVLFRLLKPDVISRVAFCLAASPRPRIFDHLRDSFMSPIIASLKQISDPKIAFDSVISPSGILFTVDQKSPDIASSLTFT